MRHILLSSTKHFLRDFPRSLRFFPAGGTQFCDFALQNDIPVNWGHKCVAHAAGSLSCGAYSSRLGSRMPNRLLLICRNRHMPSPVSPSCSCNFYDHAGYDRTERFSESEAMAALPHFLSLGYRAQLDAVSRSGMDRTREVEDVITVLAKHRCEEAAAEAAELIESDPLSAEAARAAALPEPCVHALQNISLGAQAEAANPSPHRLGLVANEAWLPSGLRAGEGGVLSTIVREPITRILSEFLHERQTGAAPRGDTFGAWVRARTPRRVASVDNALVRNFCGAMCAPEATPFGSLEERHFMAALSNLLHFTAVLTLERIDEGARAVGALLGWSRALGTAKPGPGSGSGSATATVTAGTRNQATQKRASLLDKGDPTTAGYLTVRRGDHAFTSCRLSPAVLQAGLAFHT